MIESFKINPIREQWRTNLLRIMVLSMLIGILPFGLGQWILFGTLSEVTSVFFAIILTSAGTLTLLYFGRSNGALWFFIISDSIVAALWGYLIGDPSNFVVVAAHIVGILIASLIGKPKHAIFDSCFAIFLNFSLTYLFLNEVLITSEEVLWLSSIEASGFFVVILAPLVFASLNVDTIIKRLLEINRQLEKEVVARKHAEEAKFAQVKWFRNVLDSSPDTFYVFDQDGLLIDINQSGCEKLGYSRQEILGKSIADIDADWDPARMQEQADAQMDLGDSAIVLGRNKRKDDTIFPVEVATSLLMDHGQLRRVGFARDISDRLTAEEALQQSEEKFRSIYNSTAFGIYLINTDGVLTDINDRWLEMIGYDREEMIGRKSVEFMTPASQTQAREVDFPLFLKLGYVNDRPHQIVRKSGEVFEVLLNWAMRQNEDGGFIGILASVVDVTEQNRLQTSALQSEKKFRAFFNRSSDFTFAVAPNGIILDANDRSKLFARNEGQEFVGQKFWLATVFTDFPIAQQKLADMFAKASRDGKIYRGEVDVTLLNLGTIFLDFILTPIFDESRKLEMVIAEGRDITASVHTREALRRSAEDNSVLLKEVHHRVKNNLQIVTSMLRMEMRSTQNAQLQTSFQEITNRVQSMSLIHQQLYQRNSDLGEIELDLYMHQLMKEVSRLYRLNVEPKIDVAAIRLNIDHALTCGLIVNELATNAMKYAFPDKSGSLQIIGRQKNDIISIEVIDDGIGLPKEIRLDNATSTGFQLISLMNQQLSGDISITRENGTHFMLTFPYRNSQHL